jgi:hypothetical protein
MKSTVPSSNTVPKWNRLSRGECSSLEQGGVNVVYSMIIAGVAGESNWAATGIICGWKKVWLRGIEVSN